MTTSALVQLDTLKPSEVLFLDEIEAAGFTDTQDFDAKCVVVFFRFHDGNQHTPLRVWFRKADVPEDQWLSHARGLAKELVAKMASHVADWH